MKRFLLDTNQLSEAVRGNAALLDRMTSRRLAGDRLGVSLPVLCEIEAGLAGLDNPQKYSKTFDQLMSELRIWPMDRDTTRVFGRLFNDLKARGRVLSPVDIMTALAVQMDLMVVTADKDFDALPQIQCENWIAE